MGKSSGTSSSTTIDPNLMKLYQQNYGTAQDVANRPYQAYSGPLVAPTNEAQTSAYSLLDNVSNQQIGQPQINQAISATQGLQGYQPQQVQTNFRDSAPQINADQYGTMQNVTGPGAPSQVQAQQVGANYSPQQVGAPGGVNGVTPSLIDNLNMLSANYSPQQVSAGSLPGTDLSKYMNPYTQNVVDQTQSDIERQRQMANVSDNQQATQAGAFGGSRSGVANSLTNEAALRTSAQQTAALRSQGFDNAQAQAQTDLNRQFAAGQSNQSAGLQGAALNQQGQTTNLQAALQAAQSNQNAGLTAQQANQNSALTTQGQGLQAALANQSAGQNAAALNQQGALANQSAGLAAQQSNQSAGLQTAQLGQAAQVANQGNAANYAQLNQAGQNINLQSALQAMQMGQTGQLANQNAGLQGAQFGLQAGAQLGNLGQAQQGLYTNAALAQNQVGLQEQQNQQNQYDAQYQQWLNQWNYPAQQQSMRNAALGFIPQETTTTGTKTPGLFDYLGLVANGAASYAGAGGKF